MANQLDVQLDDNPFNNDLHDSEIDKSHFTKTTDKIMNTLDSLVKNQTTLNDRNNKLAAELSNVIRKLNTVPDVTALIPEEVATLMDLDNLQPAIQTYITEIINYLNERKDSIKTIQNIFKLLGEIYNKNTTLNDNSFNLQYIIDDLKQYQVQSMKDLGCGGNKNITDPIDALANIKNSCRKDDSSSKSTSTDDIVDDAGFSFGKDLAIIFLIFSFAIYIYRSRELDRRNTDSSPTLRRPQPTTQETNQSEIQFHYSNHRQESNHNLQPLGNLNETLPTNSLGARNLNMEDPASTSVNAHNNDTNFSDDGAAEVRVICGSIEEQTHDLDLEASLDEKMIRAMNSHGFNEDVLFGRGPTS